LTTIFGLIPQANAKFAHHFISFNNIAIPIELKFRYIYMFPKQLYCISWRIPFFR